MTKTNPLLDFSDLPRFDAVLPEHVRPAIESLLDEAAHPSASLGQGVANVPTTEHRPHPVERAGVYSPLIPEGSFNVARD